MKKFIFVTSFLLFSQLSYADWLQFTTDERNTYYYESTSLRRDGSVIDLWILINFNNSFLADSDLLKRKMIHSSMMMKVALFCSSDLILGRAQKVSATFLKENVA